MSALLTTERCSLGMPVVKASTDGANTASIRVLEKLGFTFVRRATVAGLDTLFYESGSLRARGRDAL
jgi:RimJ/RimL family protein N-acetyltransferase